MAVNKFGALTFEFYTVEIGTWENYGGKLSLAVYGGAI